MGRQGICRERDARGSGGAGLQVLVVVKAGRAGVTQRCSATHVCPTAPTTTTPAARLARRRQSALSRAAMGLVPGLVQHPASANAALRDLWSARLLAPPLRGPSTDATRHPSFHPFPPSHSRTPDTRCDRSAIRRQLHYTERECPLDLLANAHPVPPCFLPLSAFPTDVPIPLA